jgi:hypothetical protein
VAARAMGVWGDRGELRAGPQPLWGLAQIRAMRIPIEPAPICRKSLLRRELRLRFVRGSARPSSCNGVTSVCEFHRGLSTGDRACGGVFGIYEKRRRTTAT